MSSLLADVRICYVLKLTGLIKDVERSSYVSSGRQCDFVDCSALGTYSRLQPSKPRIKQIQCKKTTLEHKQEDQGKRRNGCAEKGQR